MAAKANPEKIKLIAQNKKALFDYFIEEVYQAGISLAGTEVKSMRAGRCNLKESYIVVEGGEAFIAGMHVSPYEQGNIFNREPTRVRRLLMHKREIMRLFGESKQQGLAIVPLSLYFKNGRAKLSIGLCKGKKLYDKREAIAKKTQERNIQREFAQRV